jgi:hypothetical protein
LRRALHEAPILRKGYGAITIHEIIDEADVYRAGRRPRQPDRPTMSSGA